MRLVLRSTTDLESANRDKCDAALTIGCQFAPSAGDRGRADPARAAGVTVILTQIVDDPATIETTGPGWEHYLDRPVAAPGRHWPQAR